MSALSEMMLVVNGPCVSTLKEDLSVIARSTSYSVLMERTVKVSILLAVRREHLVK